MDLPSLPSRDIDDISDEELAFYNWPAPAREGVWRRIAWYAIASVPTAQANNSHGTDDPTKSTFISVFQLNKAIKKHSFVVTGVLLSRPGTYRVDILVRITVAGYSIDPGQGNNYRELRFCPARGAWVADYGKSWYKLECPSQEYKSSFASCDADIYDWKNYCLVYDVIVNALTDFDSESNPIPRSSIGKLICNDTLYECLKKVNMKSAQLELKFDFKWLDDKLIKDFLTSHLNEVFTGWTGEGKKDKYGNLFASIDAFSSAEAQRFVDEVQAERHLIEEVARVAPSVSPRAAGLGKRTASMMTEAVVTDTLPSVPPPSVISSVPPLSAIPSGSSNNSKAVPMSSAGGKDPKQHSSSLPARAPPQQAPVSSSHTSTAPKLMELKNKKGDQSALERELSKRRTHIETRTDMEKRQTTVALVVTERSPRVNASIARRSAPASVSPRAALAPAIPPSQQLSPRVSTLDGLSSASKAVVQIDGVVQRAAASATSPASKGVANARTIHTKETMAKKSDGASQQVSIDDNSSNRATKPNRKGHVVSFLTELRSGTYNYPAVTSIIETQSFVTDDETSDEYYRQHETETKENTLKNQQRR